MSPPRLLLDEHFSALLAHDLRERGHDVVAVLEEPALIGQPDGVIFAAAVAQGRRVVTENVVDFRPLQAQAFDAGLPAADLLLVATSRFDRRPSGRGLLTESLHRWLTQAAAAVRPAEDWLAPTPGTTGQP